MTSRRPATSLVAADGPATGLAVDLNGTMRHHSMIVTVTGMPVHFEAVLAVSHDGKEWVDTARVGGSSTREGERFLVMYDCPARYVRAQLAQLQPAPGREAHVSATVASC